MSRTRQIVDKAVLGISARSCFFRFLSESRGAGEFDAGGSAPGEVSGCISQSPDLHSLV